MARIDKDKVRRDMMVALVKDINKNLLRSVPKIKNAISPIIFEAVFNCPEMASVRGGVLKLDFGILKDNTFDIAEAVSRTISIRFNRFVYRDNSISGGITVQIQPTDYLNLLNLSGSVVITEKGVPLPWLDWLLNYGDSIIIVGFGVKYTDGGRTGGAVMSRGESVFRVDPTYSGSVNDNFITRALTQSYPKIRDKIWQIILN